MALFSVRGGHIELQRAVRSGAQDQHSAMKTLHASVMPTARRKASLLVGREHCSCETISSRRNYGKTDENKQVCAGTDTQTQRCSPLATTAPRCLLLLLLFTAACWCSLLLLLAACCCFCCLLLLAAARLCLAVAIKGTQVRISHKCCDTAQPHPAGSHCMCREYREHNVIDWRTSVRNGQVSALPCNLRF